MQSSKQGKEISGCGELTQAMKTTTKWLLRSRIWFPGMAKLIETYNRSCHSWQVAIETHLRDPHPNSTPTLSIGTFEH